MKKLGIKNILVAGGSDKIGRAVLPELLKAGYKIRAIQYSHDPVEVKGVEIMVECSLKTVPPLVRV